MAKLNARRHASTEEAQTSYLAKVDMLVEDRRSMPAAKAEAYRAKYDDACGIMDGNQSSGWIASEAALTGRKEEEVAESVIAAHDAAREAQAAIEAKRIAAKAAIRSAATPSDMNAIVCELREGL